MEPTVALRSDEVELMAAVHGVSERMAKRSIVHVVGSKCALRLRLDSPAAIRVCPEEQAVCATSARGLRGFESCCAEAGFVSSRCRVPNPRLT